MAEMDIDQALTSAQAAMAFALTKWPEFEIWLFEHFGRLPVGFETMKAQALQIGLLVDSERLPE
jgi:hypothetical protein